MLLGYIFKVWNLCQSPHFDLAQVGSRQEKRRVWQREKRAQNAQDASSQDQVEGEDESEGDQQRLPGAGRGQCVDE